MTKCFQLGLKPIFEDCSEQFQSGDGVTKTATGKWHYPVFLDKTFRGELDQAEVNNSCPQLLSKNVMKHWEVD